jgi:hypothetical protein
MKEDRLVVPWKLRLMIAGDGNDHAIMVRKGVRRLYLCEIWLREKFSLGAFSLLSGRQRDGHLWFDEESLLGFLFSLTLF